MNNSFSGNNVLLDVRGATRRAASKSVSVIAHSAEFERAGLTRKPACRAMFHIGGLPVSDRVHRSESVDHDPLQQPFLDAARGVEFHSLEIGARFLRDGE